MTRVAFLDRDGVINEDRAYVHKVEDFIFTLDCIETLQKLQARGYQFIIVTNQSGIGRGYYSEADYQQLTQWYLQQLKQKGIAVLDVFHCPHSPTANCSCRKPQPGLFFQAQKKYPDLDLANAMMVGDKLSDLDAAHRAGIRRLYLMTDHAQLVEKAKTLDYGEKLKCISRLNQILC